MKTLVLKIGKSPKGKIKKAAKVIRAGGLVAFPTETVYGLGANALDTKAVRKIFSAKGRPFDDPLIVHVCDEKQVYELVKEVDLRAKILMDKFWPGPLTLVLEKSKKVPKITTGNLNTVAIRMPNHKIACMLLNEAKVPIAAPSANLFGKPSPTNAKHVLEDLYGKIDCIIDGGATKIGVESTVLDISGGKPILLRPGGISKEDIERVIGKIKVHSLVRKKGGAKGKNLAKAPGMKYKHYAPRAKLIIIKSANFRTQIRELSSKYRKGKIGVITSKPLPKMKGIIVKNAANARREHRSASSRFGSLRSQNDKPIVITKNLGKNAQQAARNLFKIFREFDKAGVEVIVAQGISEKGLGMAVMNRMRKAADRII